ncbi:MAG: HAMP domain-containing sensor histidine kinase [Actinomycetota bacterium]
MAGADLSPATAARLRSLRFRMTALIALLATVAVSVFAVVVIRLDRQLRDEQIDTELLSIGDAAARQLSFEDGMLSPESPSVPDAVVALNPSFSIAEFEAQQERWDLPDPTPEEVDEFVRLAFDDAGAEGQTFVLGLILEDNGFEAVVDLVDYQELLDTGATTVGPVAIEDEDGRPDEFPGTEVFLDDLIEQIVDQPPDELSDEAYRRYVEVRADEADVELEFETVFFAPDGTPLDEGALFEINDVVTENASEPFRESMTTEDGATWDVRATALRDGPEVRGTVIAVIDPADFDEAHADLRNQVIALALALVAGSVVAAWFVAARSITPTARALAQQERFLADAAHELRTPIAAIRLTAESASPDTAATNLDRVAELAADASTLTDDLLTLARMDADRLELRREKVRLDLLVESTVAAIPGAEAAVEFEPTESVVEADARLLERAIGNLVRNALAHGAASAEQPARIGISAGRTGPTLTVRDHGPGVEDEVATELFERFSSRTGSKGHGLGLPLARWIARAHGGDLTVRAPADGGAAFDLALPGPANP